MTKPSDDDDPASATTGAASEFGAEEILHEGRHVRMRSIGGWEYVERTKPSGLVCIVAITDDRRLLLVEQLRPPMRATVVELPAGLVGDLPGEEDERLADGARRELVEETGWDADELELVATGPPSAGLTTEVMHLYRARGLRRVGEGGGDESEDIVVHAVPLAALDDWLAERVREGAMVDFKIWSGLWWAERARG